MLEQEQQIIKQIEKAQEILIVFPVDWNGDAIASSLALYLFLKKSGKKVDVMADNSEYDGDKTITHDLFSFLPSFNSIGNSLNNLRKFIVSINISNASINQIKYKMEKNTLNFIISPKKGFFTQKDISSSSSGFKYDLIITMDTVDLESLGKIYDNNIEFFYKTPIINIDHHASNEEFGQINLIDLNSVSSAEILFRVLKNINKEIINEDIATCLLTGIISKTKSFKTPNLTPDTLLTTSELIGYGARREDIINKLYRSRSLNTLKLWGKVLNNLKGSKDNTLIWSTLSSEDFQKTNASEDGLTDIISELIADIPETKIVAIIYEVINENNESTTSFLIYSIKNINSLELIKEYNPIGTKKIARAKINKPVNTVKGKIIDDIKNKLDKLSL